MEIKTAQKKKNGNIYLQLEVNQNEYDNIVSYAENKSVPLGGQVMRFLADTVEMFDKLIQDIGQWRQLARQQRIDDLTNFTVPNQSGIDISTTLIESATKLKVKINKYLEESESQKHV